MDGKYAYKKILLAFKEMKIKTIIIYCYADKTTKNLGNTKC